MKIIIAFFSVIILIPTALPALADQSTHSNGVISKIFNWKADHAERVLRLDKFPDCGNPKVLRKITKRYNWADRHTWQRGVTIDNIGNTRERLTIIDGERLINRRYCRGHVTLSNGSQHTLYYLIEQRQGFASIKWNVEYCVRGHDRWKVYGGSCRVLRR